MKLGFVGLGKMGSALVGRLLDREHEVVVFDENLSSVDALVARGAHEVFSLADVVARLDPPRAIWVMVPHRAVEGVVIQLLQLLSSGDVVIDGGNSFYKDSMRRHALFSEKGIGYMDVGVSGGPKGARDGACLMIGGDKKYFEACKQIFKDFSLQEGYQYVGPSGAGHFVKMIHNGIEYGMMQAIGEGFEIMRTADLDLHLGEIAHLYNRGSVIESRLVGWLADAYKKFGDDLLGEECCIGSIAHSGEGEWTVQTGKELGVSVPAIKASFDFRVGSQLNPSYNGQVQSALRYMFGGHDAKPKQ